jgi:hypothetical protein
MPLQSGEKLLGCAFWVSLSRQRTWPDKMLRSLQPMVKMLSSELARKRALSPARRQTNLKWQAAIITK